MSFLRCIMPYATHSHEEKVVRAYEPRSAQVHTPIRDNEVLSQAESKKRVNDLARLE